MKEETNDTIKELITRYLAGEASAEQEKQLFDWMAQSQDNEKIFLAFKKAFDFSNDHYAAMRRNRSEINVDQEWNKFLSTVSDKEVPVRKLSPITTGFWLRLAASFLILIVAGALIYNLMTDPSNEIFLTTNNTKEITLPDGSTVTLNRFSEFSLPPDFGKENRTVSLKGEAFFNITRDTQKTFIIMAGDARVEVVGTSFSVQAYDSMNNIEVIVETGKVKLIAPGSNQQVELSPGQKGIFITETNAITQSVNDDQNFQSWKTQQIIFNEADLRTVVATLNKTYHAQITITGNIPSSCALTVTFDQQTLDAVLKVLETTLNLKYRKNGNQIEIIDAGC